MGEYFQHLERIGADGLIVTDPGVFMLARQFAPTLPLHISTQAGVTNTHAARFWRGMGAQRVILARELSLEEIQAIAAHSHEEGGTPAVETFIHGAMCMGFSGRCLISNYTSDRDANRGHCSQPCRWEYELRERVSGESLPVVQDQQGTFIFNAKDLCMIAHIPALVGAGISAFKIEGRMKTSHYVAAVTRAYRRAIDDFFTNPATYEKNIPQYTREVQRISQRDYCTGFYFGPITAADHNFTGDPASIQDFLGVVRHYENGTATIEQRNKFRVSDTVQIFRAGGADFTHTIAAMYDEDGEPIAAAPHAQQIVRIPLAQPVQPLDIIRRQYNG
jgi:putative protease